MFVKTNYFIPLLKLCNQVYFWNQSFYQFFMSIVFLSVCSSHFFITFSFYLFYYSLNQRFPPGL